ncbi:hypothetical protein RMCBS344292_14615 [Rhizopus microsporus]|nr:hypothetical protein RMCBS344292_14615 [Rhizopus microsporus]
MDQNQPRKRVRTTRACVYCRKKKIRCDGRYPTCSNCLQLQLNCEYAESKKRGPRKGYVQTLEERLTEMEKRLMTNNGVVMPSVSLSPIQPSFSNRNNDMEYDLPSKEIVDHLVNIFFKHINAFLPFVHRSILKKSIQEGTIPRPLLYSVLATSARFSDHPSIRTDPPYLACERFAKKALSLVDASTLQPTMSNIQFWGIMSFVEYGRASGSMSWVYGGLAVRFCQELGYHKEEIQSTPIVGKDGSVNAFEMAMRRRIYWSCLILDKMASAGTHRPQCIERSDCDARPSSFAENILLRDPELHTNIQGKPIQEDSLLSVSVYYMNCVEKFGEVNRYMNRIGNNKPSSIVWPPIAEHRNLDNQLHAWQESLPEKFKFTQSNLEHHQTSASAQNLTTWLSSHALWCSSMMMLHRGSLAYFDMSHQVGEEMHRRIQASVETCHMCVDAAMGVFGAMKDLCHYNVLPYNGYSAYIFATALMTSAFSQTQEDREKSRRGLQILYELIEGLSPYWQMCEKLAKATKELLINHKRLYGDSLYNGYESHRIDMMPAMENSASLYSSQTYYITGNNNDFNPEIYNQHTSILSSALNSQKNNIDFNSIEFLFDTELFGQVVLDSGNANAHNLSNVPIS